MTLTDLLTRMRDVANVDSNRLPDPVATEFLNVAQADIMDMHRLRFGEALITTAFVADTQTINPAISGAVVMYPTAMWYADSSGERVDVDQISWAQYVEHYGTAATADEGSGDPSHFAVYGEDDGGNPTFYLGPIPDEDRTVFLAARTRFHDLLLGADHNQLTDRAPYAIIYRALEMAAGYLENPERIPEWNREYQTFVKRLFISHSGAQYSAKHTRTMNEQG